MHSLTLTALAFLCPMAGAAIGMACRARLPETHLGRESTDVIKLATGLMATLVALVLSLLVSSANSSHALVENEYKQALTGIVQLDKYLRAYGPEAQDIRDVMRRGVVGNFQERWPSQDFGVKGQEKPAGDLLIDLVRRILALKPADAAQAWFQAQALQLVHGITQMRELIQGQQAASSLPMPVLVVVLVCSAAIFGSFGLFVDPNPTVVTSLGVAALAVAAAIFLIVELNTPFSGLLQISSAPARAVAATLGR